MRFSIYIIIALFIISCREQNNSTTTEEYIPKSILLEDFDIPRLSSKAEEGLREWTAFRNLTQVMVSMAPYTTRNTEQILTAQPDTILTYKRLYAKSSKVLLENMSVDKDWRTLDNAKDTLYRMQKRNEVAKTWAAWREFLLKNTPYTFSIFVKNISVSDIDLYFADQDENLIVEESFVLDSLYTSTTNAHHSVVEMNDNWKELRLTFIPKTDDSYQIGVRMNPFAKAGNSFLFYRPTLQIPLQDFEKIGQASELIVQQNEVKSSYNSVYFWLNQLSDEIKQLLDENAFPAELDNPMVKSRFHLFNTQIRELADNIQNNPELTDKQTKESIRQIQESYRNIIGRINKSYENNLDELMKKIMQNRDTSITETRFSEETQP